MIHKQLFVLHGFLIVSLSTWAQKDSLQTAAKKDSGKVLSAVTVVSRKDIIENKLDKIVVNVGSMLNNAGNSVLDALSSAPNIDIDVNGNIAVRGKQGALIFIDGKQNYLSGTDLANYLKTIPASQVDQIEIMTQPSAKYDASGNAGVINIITRRGKQTGLSLDLSVNYTQGVYPKSLNSIAFNYKNKKLDVFATVDVNYFRSFTQRTVNRFYTTGKTDSSVLYLQKNEDLLSIPDYSFFGGLNYNISNHWTIEFSFRNMASQYSDRFMSFSDFESVNNESIFSSIASLNEIDKPWVNRSLALQLKDNIKANETLIADLNFESYDFRGKQHSSSSSFDSSGNLIADSIPNPFIQKADLPTNILIYTGKVDYTYVAAANAKLEIGGKISFISSDNNSAYYILKNNNFMADSNQTNHFKYKENINSLYANYHVQLNEWEFQAGVRMEQTKSTGKQDIDNQSFSKSYWELFPTFYISKKLDKNNTLTVSYGRRIDRPDYLTLNPFLYLIDPFTFKKGNPDLTPYFTNNIEFGYSFKGKLNATVNYTSTTNAINDVILQNDSTKVQIQTKENLSSYKNIGLSLNYSARLNSWYNIIVSYNLFNNHYYGPVNSGYVDENLTTNLINLTQQFRYGHGWSAELYLSYRSNFLFPALYVRGPRNVNSFTIGKDIFKGKGNVKLKVSDPFYIQKSSVAVNFENINMKTSFSEDSRRIGLTFTYHFQKGLKNKAPGIYSPEEKSRVIVN